MGYMDANFTNENIVEVVEDITYDCNPTDLSKAKLLGRELGCNRTPTATTFDYEWCCDCKSQNYDYKLYKVRNLVCNHSSECCVENDNYTSDDETDSCINTCKNRYDAA